MTISGLFPGNSWPQDENYTSTYYTVDYAKEEYARYLEEFDPNDPYADVNSPILRSGSFYQAKFYIEIDGVDIRNVVPTTGTS